MVPQLNIPFIYKSDGLSHSWFVKRIMEGWLYENPRSGYPFGSDFYDYPSSDSGNLLLIKMLSLVSKEYQGVYNLFFLLGFPLTFVSAYLSSRCFDVRPLLSFCCAFAYALLPFPFARVGHLFYVMYFVVPLYFYYALRVAQGRVPPAIGKNGGAAIRNTCFFLGPILLSSFGVYYALFGLILLATATGYRFLTSFSFRQTLPGAVCVAMILTGVGLNLTPNLAYTLEHGPNPEAVKRHPSQAETFAFKLTHLVNPRIRHRIPTLARYSQHYKNLFPLNNENMSAAMGLLGTLGLAGLFVYTARVLGGARRNPHLSLLSILVLICFLFGTVGGTGSLFSILVSNKIRGWNRISVFIAYGCLVSLFVILQSWLPIGSGKSKRIGVTILGLLICTLSFWDQTSPEQQHLQRMYKEQFLHDRSFIRNIEASLPQGAAVYQLPYNPFPEGNVRHELGAYDLLIGYLHSDFLKWSFGGMKGREGDLFYRHLAEEPLDRQIAIASRMGFDGIYVDGRAFEDHGKALRQTLDHLLGPENRLDHPNSPVFFYSFDKTYRDPPADLPPYQLMKRARYIADHLGPRYAATLEDDIDFSRSNFPDFLRDIRGVSKPESWGGRWTDAELSRHVDIQFIEPLPERFTLELDCVAFGPNTSGTLLVRAGKVEKKVVLREKRNTYAINFNLGESVVHELEIVPPDPTSPLSLGINRDTRKLGIGIFSMKLIPPP